jgi:response regulator RpfG family c-di-GMP phosphodiesterase
VHELRRSAGSQFDPAVVEAFVAELGDRTDRTVDERRVDERDAYAHEVAVRLRDVIGAPER